MTRNGKTDSRVIPNSMIAPRCVACSSSFYVDQSFIGLRVSVKKNEKESVQHAVFL